MARKQTPNRTTQFPTRPLLNSKTGRPLVASPFPSPISQLGIPSSNQNLGRRSKRPKRLDFQFKSLSIRAIRNGSSSSSRGPRRGAGFSSELTKSDDKLQELNENVVMMIRDQERQAIVKSHIEKYRDLMDSFDFPHKIKTRLLRNSNKHRLKNLKNFQYSLGQPKKVVYDKTPINIYGHRGDLCYV